MSTLLRAPFNFLATWFEPLHTALFRRSIPFTYRWRLILFQPIILLSYALAYIPCVLGGSYTVRYIPVASNRDIRTLIFRAPSKHSKNSTGSQIPTSTPSSTTEHPLRPLHLHFHAGAFVGGIPESPGAFLHQLAAETGAVVVSTTYRFAPRHSFPAAIDDADAVLKWLQEHAREELSADPELITMSGFSAGGNLALACSLGQAGVKGVTTCYAVCDLRLPPTAKPRPADFPKSDPLSFALPLYDSYAGPVRAKNMHNPRMSPILASLDSLPEDLLLITPTIDILVHEQTEMVKRLKDEIARDPTQGHRSVEQVFFDKGEFHGFAELPDAIMGPSKRKAFKMMVDFVKETHRKHGFEW